MEVLLIRSSGSLFQRRHGSRNMITIIFNCGFTRKATINKPKRDTMNSMFCFCIQVALWTLCSIMFLYSSSIMNLADFMFQSWKDVSFQLLKFNLNIIFLSCTCLFLWRWLHAIRNSFHTKKSLLALWWLVIVK